MNEIKWFIKKNVHELAKENIHITSCMIITY